MLMYLKKTNDKEKAMNQLIYLILDLKKGIKNMSKKEIKIKNPDKIVEIVEMIVDCNK